MFQTFSLYHVGYLAQAAQWTLLLSLLAFVGGALLGTALTALRVSVFRPLRWIAAVYIYVVQGTPLLVLLFIAYFGVSFAGYDLPALVAAGMALTLYASAFLADIWRGSIEAVGRGQWEGASALAMSWPKAMRHVILPQALRLALPPTVGFSVQIVKNTALASVIGFIELTRAGQIVSNSTFQPLSVYLTVAAFYFLICSTLSLASRQLDRRLHVQSKQLATQ